MSLIAVAAIPAVFAETTINFSVDRTMVVEPFEKFMITGTVSSTDPIREIMVQIIDPAGNVVFSPTIPVTEGDFRIVPRVESSWVMDGIYSIEISVPDSAAKATSQIELSMGATPPPRDSPPPPGTLMVSGYAVTHNLGNAIQSTFVNPEEKTITFSLAGNTADNQLEITLPSDLITQPNAVWVDGEKVTNIGSSKVGTATQLTIPISPDSREVVVMGTNVVPEFGTIAALILVVALVATMAISLKTQRFAFPKI